MKESDERVLLGTTAHYGTGTPVWQATPREQSIIDGADQNLCKPYHDPGGVMLARIREKIRWDDEREKLYPATAPPKPVSSRVLAEQLKTESETDSEQPQVGDQWAA
jgi:hypothetical protein